MFINYMYVDILFPPTKAITIMFKRLPYITKFYKHGQDIMERVTITSTHYHMRYRTFSLSLTQVRHNSMHYQNFNVLPTQYHTFSLTLAWFWVYLQRVTTIQFTFLKKVLICISFINFMVTRCKYPQNQAELSENVCCCMW